MVISLDVLFLVLGVGLFVLLVGMVAELVSHRLPSVEMAANATVWTGVVIVSFVIVSSAVFVSFFLAQGDAPNGFRSPTTAQLLGVALIVAITALTAGVVLSVTRGNQRRLGRVGLRLGWLGVTATLACALVMLVLTFQGGLDYEVVSTEDLVRERTRVDSGQYLAPASRADRTIWFEGYEFGYGFCDDDLAEDVHLRQRRDVVQVGRADGESDSWLRAAELGCVDSWLDRPDRSIGELSPQQEPEETPVEIDQSRTDRPTVGATQIAFDEAYVRGFDRCRTSVTAKEHVDQQTALRQSEERLIDVTDLELGAARSGCLDRWSGLPSILDDVPTLAGETFDDDPAGAGFALGESWCDDDLNDIGHRQRLEAHDALLREMNAPMTYIDGFRIGCGSAWMPGN